MIVIPISSHHKSICVCNFTLQTPLPLLFFFSLSKNFHMKLCFDYCFITLFCVLVAAVLCLFLSFFSLSILHFLLSLSLLLSRAVPTFQTWLRLALSSWDGGSPRARVVQYPVRKPGAEGEGPRSGPKKKKPKTNYGDHVTTVSTVTTFGMTF